MAQTSSAQREPSMEEILASIRRIIEDSDNVRQPLEEAGGLQFPLPEAGLQGEVEAFRAGLGEVEVRQPDVAPEPAVTEPVAAMPEQSWPAAEDFSGEMATQADAARAQFENVAPVEVKAEQPAMPPVSQLDGGKVEMEADAGQVATPPSGHIASDHMPSDQGPSDDAPGEARLSLISDHAGRQVAAAFGELSEAFAASRRRSFDEMAEEMLRPMLQDWLDNNLPTLVERLVREEIERVARGG